MMTGEWYEDYGSSLKKGDSLRYGGGVWIIEEIPPTPFHNPDFVLIARDESDETGEAKTLRIFKLDRYVRMRPTGGDA